ncbi:unnamed protein product [Thlaspi arvense]|uniref:Pectate lyase domain-containing protein n=1 Tax=Thlaspi arvense TaxID=13288 RepID=A0AAU9S335_THLAR|nr:unnamed protein product [Thlaspi arvense]
METARLFKLVCVICIASLIPTLRANVAETDEYWVNKANEARKQSLMAYHPDPYDIVDHFHERHYDNSTDVDGTEEDEAVASAEEEDIEMISGPTNSTRRSLTGRGKGKGKGKWSKLKGPCTASNPIDKCWRCQPDWAKRRKKLVHCVRGFGYRTTGGKLGRIYVVTSNRDDDMVMLLGAQDHNQDDKRMQVTVAYNHFGKGLVQRMPRIRWGFVHVVNNDYTHWELYAIGGSQGPTILSHGNRFIAPPHKPHYREVTKRDYAPEGVWKNWNWRSEKDYFMNGAYFRQSGNPRFKCSHSRQQMIKPKHGVAVSKLTKYAGALDCRVGKPC